MAKFEKFKLVLRLKAQSPMIHFQAFQNGATIRASEVKPKFDRFIVQKLLKQEGKQSVTELRRMGEYKEIFQDADGANGNDALKYKMQIACSTAPKVIELKRYSIFFGNAGKKPDEQKYGVYSNPEVTIVCFQPKLRGLIEAYIEEFFLVTNFGTMQSKGFGSFAPNSMVAKNTLAKEDCVRVGNFLKERAGGKCYYLDYSNMGDTSVDSRCVKMFKDIQTFYGIMKSGRNFKGEYARSYIYQYMHQKGIDNEKAFMKQKGIAPSIGMKANITQNDKNSKYVRALLGTTENLGYKQDKNSSKRVQISIKHAKGKLERVSSPIFFKIVGDKVFIVAFDVPEQLWEQEYRFRGEKKTESLYTPKKEEFDIHDFLDSYVRYFNSEQLRNDNAKNPSHVGSLKRERKVQILS